MQKQINVAIRTGYIEIDLRDSEVDADYSGEIGGGMPAAVWEKTVLRFSISPMLHRDDIAALIEEHASALSHLVELSAAGRNEDLASAEFELAEQLRGEVSDHRMITDLAEWLNDEFWFPDSWTDKSEMD